MDIGTHPVDRRMILEIERNASVHDIGKVGIPDNILKKPGKLTAEEWQIMKNHVMIGGEIFADLRRDLGLFEADFYKVPEEIVKFHHEKYDGSGYPYRLRGAEIPLVARIVALGDVFDALTSERVYKKAFSFEKALEIIRESTGTHFDPVVVEAFFNQVDEIKKIYSKNL
jgi:response regulator RpfG family c-di-GMP phosphodiesterase